MSLWPYTVELDGVSIPLADILADVTIHHGRADVSDEPTAATAQLTFHDVVKEFVEAFTLGGALELTARDGLGDPFPRFTGRITDARLDVDELTVIAAGPLSTLRGYPIGAGDYPEETWSARIARAFADAGLESLLELEHDPAFNPILAARTAATAGPTTLGDYLTFLLPTVGAGAADLPDGQILVQAVGARSLDDLYELDPADVTYAPAWVEELPRGNIVTVRYHADQGASVTVTEPSSIAIYGDRAETIDTALRDTADATYRANLRLGRGAFSHWNILEAPVLRGLELSLGAPILLSSMPPASPFEPWTPILEGWTDTITGDDWTMTLALSDPLVSGLTVPWVAVPLEPAYHWDTVDEETDWTEALTLEALNAG